MPDQKTRFGLTLPNRGVIIGVTTVDEMFMLAQKAEEADWDSVWVGDSIFAKPRLDALVLLGALAAKTKRVKLGPGCFASTPLRNALLLAYQWCSLDLLSGGRTIFVACQGQAGPGGGNFAEEFAAFHVEPASRMRRMEEAIEILRLTSSQEDVSYQGEYNEFSHITVLPRPVQWPIPIWVTANPNPGTPKMGERALRRVARYGDGWMTTLNTPQSFAQYLASIRRYAQEEGRDLGPHFEACLYYNINVMNPMSKDEGACVYAPPQLYHPKEIALASSRDTSGTVVPGQHDKLPVRIQTCRIRSVFLLHGLLRCVSWCNNLIKLRRACANRLSLLEGSFPTRWLQPARTECLSTIRV